MLTLKERLELLMEELGWTYADLVEKSGESRSVVSQWLGRGSKTIHSIGKMKAAERLEVESGYCALWIAKGEGPKRVDATVKRDLVVADMVRQSATLREVARMQVRTNVSLSPEQQSAYLAALDSLEGDAASKGH